MTPPRSIPTVWLRLLTVCASLFLAAAIDAQPPPSKPDAQIAAMTKLDYMIGQWHGDGWMDMGRGRETFRGSENIQRKLGGVALLVEGNFVGRPEGSDHDVPVHTTLAVISYDPQAQKYRFQSWLASGMAGERELVLIADGWQWEIRHPRGVIRYTMTLRSGEWFEIGERSSDEKTWQKFFEMTLRK